MRYSQFFDAHEQQQAQAMHAAGFSIAEIAARMQRADGTIRRAVFGKKRATRKARKVDGPTHVRMLKLFAIGVSKKQIARTLELDVKTVRKHLVGVVRPVQVDIEDSIGADTRIL